MSSVIAKPVLHGRDHSCGGADPIPGICDLSPPSGTVADAILATAPGAYYKLNETGSADWADSSPGNRDATYYSRTGTVRGVASGLDEGDGSLGVTVVGGPPSVSHAPSYVGAYYNAGDGWFDFSGLAPFSVTARVYISAIPGASQESGICGNRNAADNNGWGLFLQGTAGGAGGLVTFHQQGTGSGTFNSSVTLPVAAWTRITATYDGTAGRLYFDDTAVGSFASSRSLPTGAAYETFTIGAVGNGSTKLWAPWNGQIDSVAVWSRALSPSEVGGIAAFEDPAYTTTAGGLVLTTDGAGGRTWAAPTIEVDY